MLTTRGNIIRNQFLHKQFTVSRALLKSISANHEEQTLYEPQPYSEIPGPKPLPFIGNGWRFLPVIGPYSTDNQKWTADIREKYGNLVKISNIPGRKDLVFVFDPVDAENVYRHEGPWPRRFIIECFQYYRSTVRKDFFQGHLGVGIEDGKKWQEARSIANYAMMKPQVAKQYVPKIDEVSKELVGRMKEMRDQKNELPADFKNELNKWALEATALVMLDARLGCLKKHLEPDSDPQLLIIAASFMFESIYQLDLKVPIWKIISTPWYRKFVKHSNIFIEIALKYVKQAQEKSRDDNEDDLGVLQRVLKRDPNTTRSVVMAIEMVLAGIDTTSSTAALALYHLACNPEKQEHLYKELCNTEIVMLHSLMNRMEQHYPQADKFIPERWLRGQVIAGCPVEHKTHPFVFLPFGHGPRQCVGTRFANISLETLIARVIRDYKLEWHNGEMKYRNHIIRIPATPLSFRMIE
ncbi:hypothetical protein B566_EDAN006578, partial [Ephemera danica]